MLSVWAGYRYNWISGGIHFCEKDIQWRKSGLNIEVQ